MPSPHGWVFGDDAQSMPLNINGAAVALSCLFISGVHNNTLVTPPLSITNALPSFSFQSGTVLNLPLILLIILVKKTEIIH